MMWKALKNMGVTLGSGRALDLSKSQILWGYLNTVEDEKEKQLLIWDVFNYVKWFMNPSLCSKLKDQEDHTIVSDVFEDRIAQELLNSGKSEEEVQQYLDDLNSERRLDEFNFE